MQIAVVEYKSLAHQRGIIGQDGNGALDAGLRAFDFDAVVLEAGADPQAGFQQAHIFVACPEQGFNTTSDLDARFHAGIFVQKSAGLFQKGNARMQDESLQLNRTSASAEAG